LFVAYSDEYATAFYGREEPETGRRYTLSDLTAPGGAEKGNPHYEFLGVTRFWRFNQKRMLELHKEGRVVQAAPGAVPRQKRYLDEMRGVPLQDIWDDVRPIQSQAHERLDYPTQKPEALLERAIALCSNPGDVVLDAFVGSGTTPAVTQKLGRRWIGCDINKGATQTTGKRLQAIIADQAAVSKDAQGDLGVETGDGAAKPAQASFTTWRVNDYDLQIQHNEAVNLAAELLGVERTRADGFFDGTLGQSLVKITPFAHPLTPLDLEDIRRELEARPDEDRGVTVVCLAMELTAQSWVDEWNALRKGAAAVNRIKVIELRTDPKYGKFLKHEPAKAKVRIARKNGKIVVEVQDFISPTIIERLGQQAGVVSPKIDDWRAMVDCVMIDPAYNGKVFNVALSDVPERKTDLVSGTYELAAPEKRTTVAVKIVDMLGEEVLVQDRV
jgi:adenine-specific DNA-methyltransferase